MKKIILKKQVFYSGLIALSVAQANASELTSLLINDYLSFDPVRVSEARQAIHEGEHTNPYSADNLDTADMLETATQILHMIPREAFENLNTKHTISDNYKPDTQRTVTLDNLVWNISYDTQDVPMTYDEIQDCRVTMSCITTGGEPHKPTKYGVMFAFGDNVLDIHRFERNMSSINAPMSLKAIEPPIITFGDLKDALFLRMDKRIIKNDIVWEIVHPDATVTGYGTENIETVFSRFMQPENFFEPEILSAENQNLTRVANYSVPWGGISDELTAHKNSFNKEQFIFPLYAFNNTTNVWKLYVKYEFRIADSSGYLVTIPFNLSYSTMEL